MEKRSCGTYIITDSLIYDTANNIFYVYLHFQISENGIQQVEYSGTKIPSKPYISKGNSVLLTFRSDDSATYSGFQLNYQSKFDMLNNWVLRDSFTR